MPSKGISRLELLQLYYKALRLSGFIIEEGQDSAPLPWSRQVEPGVFDLRVVHGFYNGQPAIMQVGVNEILSKSEEYLQKQYSIRGLGGSIYIPKILFSVKNEGPEPYFCLIQEKFQNQGAPFLPRFPFSSKHQKRMIAGLYRNTLESFWEMCRDEKIHLEVTKNEGQLSLTYFSRLNRWLEMGEGAWEKSTQTRGEKQREKEQCAQDRKVIIEIGSALKNSRCLEESGLSAELFFKHFGYTDMVYCSSTEQFGLPMASMGVYPQHYGAAYWVWNVLMHSYNQSPTWATHEVDRWQAAFLSNAPANFDVLFWGGFHLNFFERIAAALLVDIPLERSPFDKNSQERKERGRAIFRKVLEERYCVRWC